MSDEQQTKTKQPVTWLEHFHWQGRPPKPYPGSDHPHGYHVVIGQLIPDPGGELRRADTPPLTPEQTEARGYDLKAIIGEFNTQLLAEHEELKAKHAEHLIAHGAEIGKLTQERDRAQHMSKREDNVQALVSRLRAENARLANELARRRSASPKKL
jgi:hypothetical protein